MVASNNCLILIYAIKVVLRVGFDDVHCFSLIHCINTSKLILMMGWVFEIKIIYVIELRKEAHKPDTY